MDRIYRGADLTIIAATRKNGLPGVGSTPKTPQRVVQFSDRHTLFVMPSEAREKIASLWSFRGWTYQEEMLSRRRLYFTSHEMLFECNGFLSCWESIREPLTDTATKGLTLGRGNGGIPLGYPLQWTLYTYYSRVSSFTRRYLTYESDTLNAFRGVMNAFIPGRSFDWLEDPRKLALYPFYGIASISPGTTDFSGLEQKVLALGLSWYHHSTKARKTRRKVGFPSWSWAGWEGLIAVCHDIEAFNEYSSVTELIQPRSPDFATGIKGLHLKRPAIRVVATIVWKELLAFSENSWQDIRLLEYSYLHRNHEAEPLDQTPLGLIALLETEKLMCVLLGWEKVPASVGSGGITNSQYFILYVLVLTRLESSPADVNGVPVTQRTGMLMFRYDPGDEGNRTELFELSSTLDLARLPRREVLIV